MSRPRMFVSSTYYDLKYVRADIEEFGQQFGLDTVLFEKGEIPYESDKELEESCYRAVEHSDLVVSIIGGRAGTKAKTNPEATISQMEVRTAHKLGKQMLFFVDRNVSVEYEIWAKNDRNKDVVWAFTEGAAVFRFIHEIRNLKLNNAMF